MQEDVRLSIGPARKAFLLDRLKRCKVRLLTSASVERINDHSIDISIKRRRDQLPADTVVIAIGYRSNNLLVDELPKGPGGQLKPSTRPSAPLTTSRKGAWQAPFYI